MLEFKKHNSIENAYNKEFMDKIRSEGLDCLQDIKKKSFNCFLVLYWSYFNILDKFTIEK